MLSLDSLSKHQSDFILFDTQLVTTPDMCPSGVSPTGPSGDVEPFKDSDQKRHIAAASLSSTMLTHMPIIVESGFDDTGNLGRDPGRDMDTCSHGLLSEMRIREHALHITPESPLLLDHVLSAPSSIALTTLTSPSLSDESPMFASSCQVSPQFDDMDYHASEWFSLFPVETAETLHTDQLDCTANNEAGSNADTQGQQALEKHLALPHEHARRHSHSSVVNRRRTKPLPPIIVEDHHDHVAMKRARNTIAARKSRQRKAQRVEDLENEILRLTAERDHWRQLAESHNL